MDKPSLKIFCVDMIAKKELEIESKTPQKNRKKKEKERKKERRYWIKLG